MEEKNWPDSVTTLRVFAEAARGVQRLEYRSRWVLRVSSGFQVKRMGGSFHVEGTIQKEV